MLKQLIALFAILLLCSCQHKLKDNSSKSEENAVIEEEETFQTVDEDQAEEIDQQTQAAIEEIEVQDRVFFDYDSSALSDNAKEILNTQAAWLKSDPSINVTIEGHCDERGTREYNIALGERRANSAKNYLVSQGVDEARIKIISYGKERPAFLGLLPEIFAKNRRAVTVVN